MPALLPPRAPARIAFLGFSDFERTALASCFRLAADRQQRFELVYTLTDADYLVADADHGPSVQLVVVTERLAETVFIGSSAPAGAAASMHRPIDALHLMKALDALALARDGASPGPMAAPSPVRDAEPPSAMLPSLRPESGVILESMLRRPVPARPAPLPAAAAAPPVFVGPPAPPRALVVDDSDIARRFLTSRLLPWGVRSDTAVTSAQVIELLAQRSYDLIFLDVELGLASELNGLALCRHIKRSALAISATVIVVSAHHTEVDRARGSLAGCDVYLGKPIKEAELAALLRRHGLVPPEGLGAKPALAPAAAPVTAPVPVPVPVPAQVPMPLPAAAVIPAPKASPA
jgi:CheY-like chemotaxis protein